MRVLDRYILKSVIGIFIACLCTFLFLYIIADIFSNLDEILKNKVNLVILGRYYLAYLPIIFVRVSPIACLLATLYTFSILNRNNEIIAMRSSGLDIFQITKTAIVFGAIISMLVFWINDRFVPQSMLLNQKFKEEIEGNKNKKETKQTETINNLSIYGIKNRLFFINKFFPGTNTIEGVVILEHDRHQNLVKKIVAGKGIFKGGLWRFYQTIIYNFDLNGQMLGDPQYFEEEIMDIPETPKEFLSQKQLPETMTIAQLDNYILKLSKSGANTVIRNLKVDLYQRFTMPLTSLIIVFLGIPFSLKIKKRVTGLSSIGFAITMGFLYHALDGISIAFGKAGILLPFLAASASHILAITLCLYLIKRIP